MRLQAVVPDVRPAGPHGEAVGPQAAHAVAVRAVPGRRRAGRGAPSDRPVRGAGVPRPRGARVGARARGGAAAARHVRRRRGRRRRHGAVQRGRSPARRGRRPGRVRLLHRHVPQALHRRRTRRQGEWYDRTQVIRYGGAFMERYWAIYPPLTFCDYI